MHILQQKTRVKIEVRALKLHDRRKRITRLVGAHFCCNQLSLQTSLSLSLSLSHSHFASNLSLTSLLVILSSCLLHQPFSCFCPQKMTLHFFSPSTAFLAREKDGLPSQCSIPAPSNSSMEALSLSGVSSQHSYYFEGSERKQMGLTKMGKGCIISCFESEEDINAAAMENSERSGNMKEVCARGHWKLAEDSKLKELVALHGPRNWNLIAEKLRGRSGKSCRLRWLNQLDPKINRKTFSEEEEERLMAAHRLYGNKWALIARLFPGRTDNAVKNHWHVIMARKYKRQRKLMQASQWKVENGADSVSRDTTMNAEQDFRNLCNGSFMEPSHFPLVAPSGGSCGYSNMTSNEAAVASGKVLFVRSSNLLNLPRGSSASHTPFDFFPVYKNDDIVSNNMHCNTKGGISNFTVFQTMQQSRNHPHSVLPDSMATSASQVSLSEPSSSLSFADNTETSHSETNIQTPFIDFLGVGVSRRTRVPKAI